MSVELPLKEKYTRPQSGKIRTRAAGGGNSAKKHPNRHTQGAGLRIEGDLKKIAMAQTEANRRVLVFDSNGRKHWLLLSVYTDLQKSGGLAGYLRGR